MGEQQKNTFFYTLVGTVFFMVALVLLKFAFEPEDNQKNMSSLTRPKQVSIESPEAEKAVNKYLKEINKAIEMQQLQSKVQNKFIRPKVGEVITVYGSSRSDKNLKVESVKDDHSMSDYSYDTSSVSGQIQLDLAEQQRLEEYDKKYKEEYIRQFVENARKNGWKIVVDQNGVIRSATQINQ